MWVVLIIRREAGYPDDIDTAVGPFATIELASQWTDNHYRPKGQKLWFHQMKLKNPEEIKELIG